MRTTINLPDALAQAARDRARAERRTFTSLVEEGLRTVLHRGEEPADLPVLPSYGDPDGRFLVDLDDRDAVAAALDVDGIR